MNYLSPLQRVSDIRRVVRGVWSPDLDRITDHRSQSWQSRPQAGISAGVISWQSNRVGDVPRWIFSWGGNCRYWQKGDAGRSNQIFQGGSLLATIPQGVVAGVAVQKNAGRDYLIAVSTENRVFRAEIDAPDTWQDLGNFAANPYESTQETNQPADWHFNSTGTRAVRVQRYSTIVSRPNEGEIQRLSVIGETIAYSFEPVNSAGGLETYTVEFTPDDSDPDEVTESRITNYDPAQKSVLAVDFVNDAETLLTFSAEGTRIENRHYNDQTGIRQLDLEVEVTYKLQLGGEVLWSDSETESKFDTNFSNTDGTYLKTGVDSIWLGDAHIPNRFFSFQITSRRAEFNEGQIRDTQVNVKNYLLDGVVKLLSEYDIDRAEKDFVTQFGNLGGTQPIVNTGSETSVSDAFIDRTQTARTFTNGSNWAHDQWQGYLIAMLKFQDWQAGYDASDSNGTGVIEFIPEETEYTTTGADLPAAIGGSTENLFLI